MVNKYLLMAAIAMLAMSSQTSGTAHAQQNRESFIRWAKEHAIPLRTVESEKDDADLRPIKSIVGNARVVALGEPTHGAHEPLAFRNRLFRFLVEEMGFTAIALEASLAQSRYISDYIAGGPETAHPIIREAIAGRGENAELIRWMREYNSKVPGHRKVHFYGIDLDLGGMGNSFPTPGPINEALSYLSRVDALSERRIRTAIEPYLSRIPGEKPPAFSSAEHNALTSAIEDLIALLERERPAFVAATSETDYEWAHRNAIVARQADRVFRVIPPDMQPGKISPAEWQTASTRDAAMADNLRWELEREGPQGRILLYAHDAHVKNARTAGGLWSVFERPPNSMGQYLRRTLGSNLVIMGISSARNTLIPSSPAPAADSIDATLAEVGEPRFLLDIRASRNGKTDHAVTAWLAEPHALTANLMSYMNMSPGDAFDVLVFIDKLTALH